MSSNCRDETPPQPKTFAQLLLIELVDFFKTAKSDLKSLESAFKAATKPVMADWPNHSKKPFTHATLTVWYESAKMICTTYRAQVDALETRVNAKTHELHPTELAPLVSNLPKGACSYNGERLEELTVEDAREWLRRFKGHLVRVVLTARKLKEAIDGWEKSIKEKCEFEMSFEVEV